MKSNARVRISLTIMNDSKHPPLDYLCLQPHSTEQEYRCKFTNKLKSPLKKW